MYRFVLFALAALLAVFAVGCAVPAASSTGGVTPATSGVKTPAVTSPTETPATASGTESPLATPATGVSPVATPGTGAASIAPDLGNRAVGWLASEAKVSADTLRLVSAERVEWTDSCFGLGGPAESCLQAMTPGWRITFEAGGKQYEVRTDETGTNFRLATPAS